MSTKRAAASSPASKATSPKSVKSAIDEEIAPGASKEEVTPYDAYFKRLDAVRDSDPNILGPTIVRGIRNEDDDEDEDEVGDSDDEEQDTSKYTAAQMETLRYIMITKNREKKLKDMAELILGDQAGDSLMCFNTSFSYQVADAFRHLKNRLWSRAEGPSAKFDLLFAFTQTIERYDVWMHDNEGGMEGWVGELGNMWKRLLRNADEKLGIDAEFTRPGIVCFLEQFKKNVEEALNQYADPPLDFKFQ